jgi:ATP-dependent exoDNAse (exonuclease V) alpha subunit
VAIFYLQISSLSRGAGRRATAAAAYRAGERLRDERSGELFNYRRRRDVLHTEIFLPAQFDNQALDWARDRERLWNTAELAEKRYHARVAREYQLSLPSELDAARRIGLARSFAIEVARRYHVAVDLAVHEPRPGGDPRNFHAHLLTTTREVTPAGLGAKAGLDLGPVERRRRQLPDHRAEYLSLRERWAELVNAALAEAHLEARVDHRSLAAQGLDREPAPRIPLMQLKMEQRGVRSGLAERLRADYRERIERRRQPEATRQQESPGADRAAGNDIDEIRRQAREAWKRLRAQMDGLEREPTERAHEGEQLAAPAEPDLSR